MGLDSLGRLPTIFPERVVLIILFVVRRMTALSGSSHALAAFLVVNPEQSSADTVCTRRWSSDWLRVSGPGQTRGVVLLMSVQGSTPSFEKSLDISADSVRRKRGEGVERRGHMLEVCSHALCGICSEMSPLVFVVVFRIALSCVLVGVRFSFFLELRIVQFQNTNQW